MRAVGGWQILIVEDDPIIGIMLADMVRELGCAPIGPAGSVKAALTLLEATPSVDGAVLDCNLGKEMVWPVAARLVERGLPFVFSTGYGEDVVNARFPGVPVLAKPLSRRKLERALAQATATRRPTVES